MCKYVYSFIRTVFFKGSLRVNWKFKGLFSNNLEIVNKETVLLRTFRDFPKGTTEEPIKTFFSN